MTVQYHLATAADDADLRRLLREQVMDGWVNMALLREPSFFAAAQWGHEWAIVAREAASGQAIGLCTCCEQAVHCNGQATTLGYLGALRIHPAWRKRIRVLRGGFQAVRKHSAERQQTPLWYTSIAADNTIARRILEAHLPAMPRYVYLNDMVTLVLPASRAQQHGLWHEVAANQMQQVCDWHNQQAGSYQFAPVLTPTLATQTGAQFYALRSSQNTLLACMALWNQQAYRQVVAQSYKAPFAHCLPLYNLWAQRMRRVALPAPGTCLDHSFMAFFAHTHEVTTTQVLALVEEALALCGTPALTLGLHAQHPLLPALQRHFKPLHYRTRIYAVHFDVPPVLDGRLAQPEVAVL